MLILDISPTSTPAVPANNEPNAKVSEITLFVLIPIKDAASISYDVALIALPTLVFFIINCSNIQKITVVRIAII